MEGRGSVWHTQKNTMRQNVGQLGISLRRLRLTVGAVGERCDELGCWKLVLGR